MDDLAVLPALDGHLVVLPVAPLLVAVVEMPLDERDAVLLVDLDVLHLGAAELGEVAHEALFEGAAVRLAFTRLAEVVGHDDVLRIEFVERLQDLSLEDHLIQLIDVSLDTHDLTVLPWEKTGSRQ